MKIRLSKWAENNGYSYQGAHTLFKKGGIPNAVQNEITKTIMVEVDNPEYNVIYCKEEDDTKKTLERLKRICDHCNTNRWFVSDKTKTIEGLIKILKSGNVTRLIIEENTLPVDLCSVIENVLDIEVYKVYTNI